MTTKLAEWKELFSLIVSCKYKYQTNKGQDARISKTKNVATFKFCNYYGVEAKRLKKYLLILKTLLLEKTSKTS